MRSQEPGAVTWLAGTTGLVLQDPADRCELFRHFWLAMLAPQLWSAGAGATAGSLSTGPSEKGHCLTGGPQTLVASQPTLPTAMLARHRAPQTFIAPVPTLQMAQLARQALA